MLTSTRCEESILRLQCCLHASRIFSAALGCGIASPAFLPPSDTGLVSLVSLRLPLESAGEAATYQSSSVRCFIFVPCACTLA